MRIEHDGITEVDLTAEVRPPAAAPAPSGTPTPPGKGAGAPTPAAPGLQSLLATAQGLSDALLAAARAGDARAVSDLLDASFVPPAKFSTAAAARMLDDLVRGRELAAFTTLHDELKKTLYGQDWRIGDELLASLVKDGRTDFLDVLLARRLVLDRLARLANSADPKTGEWITRRVAEVTRQRADLEALGNAAAAGDLPAIQRLLDAGADVNGVGKDDDTPLIRAVSKDRLEAAQFLLDHGAQVDKPRFPGWDYTPLCLVRSVPMAELLKKNGANLHARLWRRDASILVYVAVSSKPEVVEWFFQQGFDPKMTGDFNENLLFTLKDGRTARLLLDAGADPNRVNDFGRTPLMTAQSGEVAQALIEHGAKLTGFKKPLLPQMIVFASGGAVEAALKAGVEHDPAMLQQALIEAAHGDHDDTVRALLKYGANPNEPGLFAKDMPLLPLYACCIWGGVKAARALLAAGADPNGGERPGMMLKTALHNGYKELAGVLRQAGARGVSDLAFAIVTHDQATINALLATAPAYMENAAFWADAVPDAARVGDLATVRAALAKGASLQLDQSARFADAYCAAAGEGQDEALAILLATRKPGDDSNELRPALWEAVWNCHPDANQRSADHFEKCVEMLLAAGAPVNGDDGPRHERNLVSAAVFSRYPGGSPAVMEMLVRAGADPNPVVGSEKEPNTRLIDAVREACAKGYCSTPLAETLVKLNGLAAKAGGQPPPGATPSTPTPADHGAQPEKTGATTPETHPGIDSTGRVSMADGTPLGNEPITVRIYSLRGHGDSFVHPERAEAGSFPLRLPEDTTTATVAVEQKGCAAVFFGPLDGGHLGELNDLQVRLTRGYTASVQIVDEAGQPIAGARLRNYYRGPPAIDLPETVTDPAGTAVIEHVGEAPLNLRVLADGFQADEVAGLHLDPAKPYRWTLRPTPPLHGSVAASATGQPIAGAVIKLAGVRGPHDETYYDPRQAPVLTAADAQGRFTLGSLRPDSRYSLFVEAPGYGGACLRGIELAPGELKVALGPELLIRGRIIHAPPSVIHLGKVHLEYGQTFHIGDNDSGVSSENLDLTPVNGEADFTVGPFYKGFGGPTDAKNVSLENWEPIGIHVDLWGLAKFSVDELPVSDFVFDLADNTLVRDADAPVLPHRIAVKPEIKKAFQGNDEIQIREVTGTAANFQVGGTYRVTGICRQQSLGNARLSVGNTAEPGFDAIIPVAGSSLSKALPKGSTVFDCTFKLLRPGILHVTIYDLDDPDKRDNAAAGIYLGDVVFQH